VFRGVEWKENLKGSVPREKKKELGRRVHRFSVTKKADNSSRKKKKKIEKNRQKGSGGDRLANGAELQPVGKHQEAVLEKRKMGL